MYCENCGKEQREGQNFCPYCGAATERAQVSVPSNKNKKRKSIRFGLIVGIATVIMLIAALVFTRSWYIKTKDPQYQMELGRKYLEEMKYEQAIAAFERALEINPKNADTYIALADVYMEISDMESALEILEEGLSQTQNEQLKKKTEELQMAEAKSSIPQEESTDKSFLRQIIENTDAIENTENIKETNTPVSRDSLLEECASHGEYLYGESYDGYIYKGEWSYGEDFSEIPVQDITWHIADYDGDGENELLMINLTDIYYLNLRMYEVKEGKVVLSDELSLEEYDYSIFINTQGDISCYTYESEKNGLCIGIESWDIAQIGIADGTRVAFLSLSYGSDGFQTNGSVDYIGSDGIPEETYMDTLHNLGIDASWDDLFTHEKSVSDYVEVKERVLDIETVYLIDYEDFWEWQENGSLGRLCISRVYFGNDDGTSNTDF